MAERPEDLNLPSAVVCRIVKDALPPNTKVTKEAQAAIAKVCIMVKMEPVEVTGNRLIWIPPLFFYYKSYLHFKGCISICVVRNFLFKLYCGKSKPQDDSRPRCSISNGRYGI